MRLRLGFALALLALAGGRARAQEPMRYLHPPPESALDTRYQYQWAILRTALERTRPGWGPFVLADGPPMPEKRQVVELINPSGNLSVIYLDTTPELEQTLRPVRIPVDKNLGGYRVFLIRKADRARFDPARIRTLADLRRFSVGLGLGWIDVEILRHNGFQVVTGSDYEGLFSMLANHRFDLFLRGAVEVTEEFDQRRATLTNLEIEPNFAIYYPLPMYFWFSRTPEGERLAARAREGMLAMIRDGSYDRIFWKYQKARIERLGLRQRRLFRIANPFLVPETPFGDRRLWFDPYK
jgi:ABC-type amino acid transport substrate-binding protein